MMKVSKTRRERYPGERGLVMRSIHSGQRSSTRSPLELRHFFQRFEMGEQFVFLGPAHKIQLNHFKGSAGGLAAGPQPDQQRRQQRDIDLQRQPRSGLGQPGGTAQNTLEPAEEQ